MRDLRRATLPVAAAAVLLTACGDDPARGVAVPGAPAAVTTLPRATTTTSTTVVPTPVAPTTVAATTTTAPAPTTTVAPSTSAAPTTTVPPVATTIAPTTTELVYVPEPATGTLRFGMEGPRSLQLQRDLIQLGFLPPGADDGLYGPGTAGGVRRFQESEGLVVDGVAGPVTQERLAQVLAAAAEPPPDE